MAGSLPYCNKGLAAAYFLLPDDFLSAGLAGAGLAAVAGLGLFIGIVITPTKM